MVTQKAITCNSAQQKMLYAIAVIKRDIMQELVKQNVYEVNAASLTEDTNEEIAFLGSLTTDVTGCPWMTET